jgi:hypothetical protein
MRLKTQFSAHLGVSPRCTTLKADCQGTIDIAGCCWRIGKTLAGERLLIQPVDGRYLVYYCATLVRELDPAMKRSTIVERFIDNQNPFQLCVTDLRNTLSTISWKLDKS